MHGEKVYVVVYDYGRSPRVLLVTTKEGHAKALARDYGNAHPGRTFVSDGEMETEDLTPEEFERVYPDLTREA